MSQSETFSFRKMDQDEAAVIRVLSRAKYALNAKEIYRAVLGDEERVPKFLKRSDDLPPPAYTTIMRVLEKLYKLKYIGRRPSGEGRAKYLYYLSDDVISIAKKESAQKNAEPLGRYLAR